MIKSCHVFIALLACAPFGLLSAGINASADSEQQSAPGISGKVTTSPHGQARAQATQESFSGVDKVAGGNSIAEIHADKAKLNGKTLRVRGKVTRFNANIMGKNWLHIRDSSTLDDLTVTTGSVVAVGDVVVLEGKLELDQDFGYGYVYPVILQNASLSSE